jgi:hypothetical protein
MEAVPGADLANTYLLGLKAKGFIERGGRVRRLALWEALKEQWGTLHEMRVGVGRHFPAWLTQLYSPDAPVVRCPVYHLFLIGLLFNRISVWHSALSNVCTPSPPRGQEVVSDKLRFEPAMGTRFVQLQHWIERDGEEPDQPLLPTSVAALLEGGRPVREVAAATGLSRFRIYRALRRSPQLARTWALSALALENQRRCGTDRLSESTSFRRGSSVSRPDKKWLYRHRSALTRCKRRLSTLLTRAVQMSTT